MAMIFYFLNKKQPVAGSNRGYHLLLFACRACVGGAFEA